MDIPASLVKELRERTGLSLMECKKALVETEGNLEKAIEVLRLKSGAKADKVAQRSASEGVIGAYVNEDSTLGALVEVNCETDFVGRNDDFLAFAHQAARVAAFSDAASVDALMAISEDGKTLEVLRQELVMKVGENVAVRRFVRQVAQGRLALYVHGGKIGVLVDYEGQNPQIGKDLALHIAAMKPQWLEAKDVPQEVLAKEREIVMAQASQSGKPEAVVEKMVEGRMGKFVNELTLLGQAFVKDNSLSVGKWLAEHHTRVLSFHLLVLGGE